MVFHQCHFTTFAPSLGGARLSVLEWAGHPLCFMHGTCTREREPAVLDESLRAFQEVDRDRFEEYIAENSNDVPYSTE